jgi:hypothetical protein
MPARPGCPPDVVKETIIAADTPDTAFAVRDRL